MNNIIPEKLLRIEICSKCNFKCEFCCWENANTENSCSHLTSEDIKSFCESAVRTGCYNVNLTGGEPLLLDEDYICDVVQKIKQVKGIKQLWITTNGTRLINKKFCVKLKNAGLKDLAVSIPAENDIKYREYSHSQFGLTDILKGIKNATECGIQVRAHIPLNPKGIHRFEHVSVLIPLLKEAGVHTLFYFKINNSNKIKDSFDDLRIDPKTITDGFDNNPMWHFDKTPAGRPFYTDLRETFRIFIPRESVYLVTDNCKKQHCGSYCQGIYSIYLLPGEKNWKVRSCHRIFEDKRNEYQFENSLLKEKNGDKLYSFISNIWKYAYEK